jgi:hypothetical protein
MRKLLIVSVCIIGMFVFSSSAVIGDSMSSITYKKAWIQGVVKPVKSKYYQVYISTTPNGPVSMVLLIKRWPSLK